MIEIIVQVLPLMGSFARLPVIQFALLVDDCEHLFPKWGTSLSLLDTISIPISIPILVNILLV